MYKINLVSTIAIGLLVSACGGGGGGSNPPVTPPTSSAAATSASSASIAPSSSSSSIVSSVVASSSSSVIVTVSSAATSSASSSSISSSSSSSSSIVSSSSSSAASVYSANVDHLKDLATFPIGVSVSNTDSATYNILTNVKEKGVVEKHFSQMTAGNIMKMMYMHPSLNTFSYTNADAFVDYANTKGMTIHGHALIWHSDYQVPAFMKNWSGTSADFLTMLDTHVTTIVDHFETKTNLVSWDVVNEALNDNSPSGFRTDSAFYIKSGNSAVYIERAFQAARLANPTVDLYYNDYNIDQNNAKTTALVNMITDFQTRSIPITGVGFQMHVFVDYPTIANIKAAMKKVADKGLKVKITELDVAINNPYNSGWSVATASTYNNTTAFAQKKRYCEIVAAYNDVNVIPVNQRGGITVWGVTDTNTWLTAATSQYSGQQLAWPLLFDGSYNDKPALRGFADGLLGTACTNL